MMKLQNAMMKSIITRDYRTFLEWYLVVLIHYHIFYHHKNFDHK